MSPPQCPPLRHDFLLLSVAENPLIYGNDVCVVEVAATNRYKLVIEFDVCLYQPVRERLLKLSASVLRSRCLIFQVDLP